jgi:hypothetical protein
MTGAQLYARLYRSEVVGLVPVDSTHPTQFQGAGSMQSRSTLSRLAIAAVLTGSAKVEFEARLYPSATVREVDSDHDVRQDKPQAVIDAIHEVLNIQTRRPAQTKQ